MGIEIISCAFDWLYLYYDTGLAAYTILIFHIGCHELCNTSNLGRKCFFHNFLILIHTYYLQLKVLMWRIRSWHSTYCAMDSSRTPMWCDRAFFRSFIYFIAWYLLSRVWFNPSGAAWLLVISCTNGNAIFCMSMIMWAVFHHKTFGEKLIRYVLWFSAPVWMPR